MRARRDRTRPTSLRLTQLEDRSVPAVLDVTLPPPPPFDPHADAGLNFQPPTTVLGGTQYLTAPQEGDALTLARYALVNNAAAMNLSPADVAGAQVTDFYRSSTGTQLSHAYFRQYHNGLEVLNTSIGVHVAADGRILSVNGGFVSGLGGTQTGVIPTPAVAVADAVSPRRPCLLRHHPVVGAAPDLDHRHDRLAVDGVGTGVGPGPDRRPAGVRQHGRRRLAWHFDIDVPAPDQCSTWPWTPRPGR